MWTTKLPSKLTILWHRIRKNLPRPTKVLAFKPKQDGTYKE